jgi:RND family efflux transporter MFP subunit
MIGKYVLPALAVMGLIAAAFEILTGEHQPAYWAPAARSVEAPFASNVAGTGIVEASTENIAIGTPVSGVVASVLVRPGSHVRAGEVLFKIDDRELTAQLLPATAQVGEAEATLARDKDVLDRGEALSKANRDAITVEELRRRRFVVAIDQATLDRTKADVERLKILLSRYTITAPVNGLVMQVKIRTGEFATTGVLDPPLMVLGGDARLHVRVDIDEQQAWRVKQGAPAVAFVRGNPDLKTSLQFERLEPMAVRKASLTGESIERTDTRVLQVIYSFDPAALPVYVGQQLDVFIDASPDQVLAGGVR